MVMKLHQHQAPGVLGGHVSAAHNLINFDTMTQVLNSGVTANGNNRNSTCNGAYKGSLNVGAVALTKPLLSSKLWRSRHDCQSAAGSI